VIHADVHAHSPHDLATTFAFLADATNATLWDPAIVEAHLLTEGQLAQGSRFLVLLAFGDDVEALEFVLAAYEAPQRLVFTAHGDTVDVTTTFVLHSESDATGVDLHWEVDPHGRSRLLAPLLRRRVRTMAHEAATGLERELAR
jgi:hypothetical protein